MHHGPKIHLRQWLSVSSILNLFLIFSQISGSCSHKIALLKPRVYNIQFFASKALNASQRTTKRYDKIK